MANIFSEYKIKNLVLKNRIVMPPMCVHRSGKRNGYGWHVIHYATRAVGGVGLIIVEQRLCAPEGRLSSNDLGIWDDAHVDGLASIVKAVHENGAKIEFRSTTAAENARQKGMDIRRLLPFPMMRSQETPREMAKADIAETVNEFKNALLSERIGQALI